MRGCFRVTPASSWLGAVTLAATAAAAQNPTYEAGEGCPDEAVFRAELRKHLRSALPVESPAIRVHAQLTGDGAIVRVTQTTDGTSETREVHAPSCDEAVTAAALVAALAIDAYADAHETPPRPKPAPESAPTSPAPPAVRDRSPRAVSGASELALPDRCIQCEQRKSVTAWQAGVGAYAAVGVIPEPLIGLTGFVGLSREPSWDARIGFVFAPATSSNNAERSADFELLGGRLEGCALPVWAESRFRVHPCLMLELASVRSEGTATPDYSPSVERVLRAAGSALIRAQVVLHTLRLEGYAGPTVRIAGTGTYVFTDATGELVYYEAPRIGSTAGVNLAVTAP
jgi:hypothetical protein